MRQSALLILTVLCAAAASGAAADYKSEYKAYNAAIAEGDVDKALDHGEAAWRQAEDALGETATTAILAYNYAVLVAAIDPSKSLEAFDRAIKIAEADGGHSISLKEAILRRSEARVRSNYENNAPIEELDALLMTADSSDATMSEAQVLGWRTLAVARIGSRKYAQAKVAADTGAAIAARLDPPAPVLQREILFLAGLARVAGVNRTEEEVYEAVVLFDRTTQLFPPQKDIDHFDRLLAKTIAWRQSLGALADSYGSIPTIKTGSRLPDGEDLKSAYERANARSSVDKQYSWETPPPAICAQQLSWRERKLPKYPRSAIVKGSIGAILIGYDVNGIGVERSVILADFASAGFGAAAVESMKDWRLEPGSDPACWKNLVTNFNFIMN